MPAGEFGFVEIQQHALEPGDFMGSLGIRENPHPGGDHSAQRQVAQGTDFDVGALFADLAFDGGAP